VVVAIESSGKKSGGRRPPLSGEPPYFDFSVELGSLDFSLLAPAEALPPLSDDAPVEADASPLTPSAAIVF
jgi:hypothetical protein